MWGSSSTAAFQMSIQGQLVFLLVDLWRNFKILTNKWRLIFKLVNLNRVSIASSPSYIIWIQLPEHFAAFIFSCKHWIPKAYGKTVASINITNKISKRILIIVISSCIRGTGHSVNCASWVRGKFYTQSCRPSKTCNLPTHEVAVEKVDRCPSIGI